ncbi:unnamed protein product [Hermetia illucens]|uniref:Uncharacterized protein n=1 Tax=Hermetia illucens TaxID=343691 RepID=A0A7R8UME9_HERIL|nr:unnamed protein product [Hermetia illucens]
MDPSQVTTVPRKRRPRAAGEVSIASSSTIYFRDPNEPPDPNAGRNQEFSEHLYQNTEGVLKEKSSLVENDKKKNSSEVKVRFNTFCALRQKCNDRDGDVENQLVSVYIDDSDHLYEPLCHIGHDDENVSVGSRQNGKVPPAANSRAMQSENNNSGNCYSDEYDDSFSDEDTDEEVKKNDSGVDISNTRLPDPPSTTNQVYAFVKKIKNFGSLSKSLSKISMRKSTPSPKAAPTTPNNKYENTQFYVDNDYQNTSFDGQQKTPKQKTPKTQKKGLKLPKTPNDDPYENTEFHTPITPKIHTSQSSPDAQSSPLITPANLSQSDKSLSETANSSTDTLTLNRKKSKSGKSFKSKFRKSLAGTTESSLTVPNAFNATRSTFYISDSVDVDSGIFEKTSPNSEPNLVTTNEEKPLVEKTSTVVRKTKKSLSSPELNRRRTTIGIRPPNPPPPPPVDKKSSKQKHASTTSWYTECGVFKPPTLGDELLLKDSRSDRNSNTSWYAEAGLYHTSGASVASSSGSSGVSTGGEGGPGDDHSHSMFLNEPLYQIYSAAKLQSITDIEDQESTDGYEEIGLNRSSTDGRKSKRPSAFQLIGPRQGPSRTLWSEIPEVQTSGILATLSSVEKRLQEAKFEILTSEASYLKSLNLLKKHFMGHPAFRDTAILSGSDRKTLFYSILPVQECSDRLLCDLENCWQDNIMLLGLSKSIYKHAEKYFHVYVSYCENQGKMDRTLRRLKEEKGVFSQELEVLESDPECCSLNLHSFLMLPMQRITRLPLLIDAVFTKLKPDDEEYEDWKLTLGILNKIVTQCNEAANRCEQAYEIERISRQIEFPSNIRSLAIAPAGISAPGAKPRSLVRKGELVQLIWRGDDGKLTFGKKFIKSNIFAFLFTDLLVLTKRKGEQQFVVFDYCLRSMLTVSSGDVIPQLPTKEVAQAGKNLILMTLLENHDGKTVELILSCSSVSERQRWLEATKPLESEDPNETLYEQWDCPQVLVKHEFTATEPDMLSLQLGDVINVNRKMVDGWYQGERIRDGATGWFPGNFTEEINSAHVRARNLKQRYRLLTLTASYIESQRKKS